MASSGDAPLLDPRTWMRRAVADAVERHPSARTGARDTYGPMASALAEAGMAEGSWHQANVTEAKQAAYLTVTTALARHSIATRSAAEATEAREVAELLWSASRWLWSVLAPHERIGACRVPPASRAPAIEVRPQAAARRRRRPDRRGTS